MEFDEDVERIDLIDDFHGHHHGRSAIRLQGVDRPQCPSIFTGRLVRPLTPAEYRRLERANRIATEKANKLAAENCHSRRWMKILEVTVVHGKAYPAFAVHLGAVKP